MPKVHEVHNNGKGIRIGIVASRFNEFVTNPLLENALSTLLDNGVREEDIEIARVPGAFEIPITAKKMALTRRFDSILCLGAIIRGETPHFEYLCGEVFRGLGTVCLEVGIPLIHGVLTTDTIDQAIERAGSKPNNKGKETALNAIEMAHLVRRLKS